MKFEIKRKKGIPCQGVKDHREVNKRRGVVKLEKRED
jgi:hypothetical protein